VRQFAGRALQPQRQGLRFFSVAGIVAAMNHRIARFLLLVAALWLPVQTSAALAMPLCHHVPLQLSVDMTDHAAMEAGAPCHEAATPDPATHEAGCDNCQTCHMAGAGFMPSTTASTGFMPVANAYSLPAIMAPPSHIGEPPQHPPRPAA
jgi:hypothetical protein